MCEDFGILVLADQHRQAAVRPQMERRRNIFMPEQVDSRSAEGIEARIDPFLAIGNAIVQRCHPTIDQADQRETTAAPDNATGWMLAQIVPE